MAITACGGGSSSSGPQQTLAITLGSSSVVAPQDGTTAAVTVNIAGQTGTPTVVVSGLPAGLTGLFAVTNGGPSGTITFTGSAGAAAGSYTATVTATAGGQTASQNLKVVSAVVAKVSNVQDTSLGVNGNLKQLMSTSFQIGGWTTDYFGSGSTMTARQATLTQLDPQHIRVQVVSGAIPMVSDTNTASDWDFTLLDQTLQPVLGSADMSPELQVAVAPGWMCTSNGTLDIKNHVNDFAVFMANMVRYYNKGGFTAGSTHFQSPGSQPIVWWGIFNEFNGNGLSASDYVTLYNTVVPAMLAVDPTIKLSAFEFSDYGLDTGDGGDPMVFLPAFVAPASSGGVNTQVDIVSTHFYGTCNQNSTDVNLFGSVPGFAANVQYFYQQLRTRPDLANTPVWVTENNVNADFSDGNGMSVCNPGQPFVTDTRGTSAFFAAWRPYVFSQLGKVGNQALYHWSYLGGQQYAEVDDSGNPYLSYWVDKTLENLYPFSGAVPGEKILTLAASDTSSVETLATENANGSVTVMMVDRAVHAAADNNGSGDPRTVIVDLSELGNFSTGSLLTLDANTNVATGPTAVSVIPAARMTITLNGYGTSFLTLNP